MASAPNRPRRVALIALAAVLAALALAACGSSSNNTTTTTTTKTSTSEGGGTKTSTTGGSGSVPPSTKTKATEQLSLEANPKGELKYNKATLTATAGVAAITLTNNSPLAHNVTIENSAGTIVGGTTTFQGGSHTLRVALKAGTYKFFCSVPGHRMAGMEGTLTVQ